MAQLMYSARVLPVLLLALFLAACSGSREASDAPAPVGPGVVANIAGSPFSLPDFERRYARSVGGVSQAVKDSLADYRDFLERYAEFRMKVLYAEELGFARDSVLTAEVDTYRKQLARPFLLEREIMDPILRSLYERQQKMVDASHILVRAGQSAPPADTLAAYQKLDAIRDSILAGADFGAMAVRHSDDPSARGERAGARGRLGYFAGGQMVQAFEDAAYRTPVDSVSEVFRSQFGYHILKVHGQQDRVLDRWASHIAVRDLPLLGDTTTPMERIQAIYARLQAGEDFRALAREKSEDTETGSRGGQIGRISYTMQQIPLPFRDALFAIEEAGGYSDIVETPYGLHIVRLDQIEEPRTFEESYEELKTQATRLPRVQAAERSMAMKIRDRAGVFVDTTGILATLNGRIFRANDILQTPTAAMAAEVVGIGSDRYTFEDIVTFAETVNLPYTPDTTEAVYNTIDAFLNNAALDYEAARLEARNDDFQLIMEEFRDGLLLFKLMEDSVWTAAARDTAALMAYHSPRADSFWFPDRTRILTLRSNSDSTLTALTQNLGSGATVASVVQAALADSALAVRVDTTFLAEPNNSLFDRALRLKAGEATDPIINASAFIVLINDGIEPARRKTFWEARSEVLNAYQEILENRLISRLRSRYEVRLNPDALVDAFAEEKRRAAVANLMD